MKAAVSYESNGKLTVEEVELDDPQAFEVMVDLKASGICHSDLHFMKGEMMAQMPIVMGHEGAGIVEKVGPCVTTLKPGDHVVTVVAYSCGKCRFCSEGRPTHCMMGLAVMGMAALPSMEMRLHKGDQRIHHLFGLACFAEKTVVHERQCIKIPDDIPFEIAAPIGCGFSTGIGAALNTARIKAGDSVVVYGCGGVGLAAVMGAKLAGAGKLIAVSRSKYKLDKALELGADYVVNPNDGDPVAKVKELTGGGADHAIEAAGKAEVIMNAFGSIHFGGKCIVAGMAPMGSMLNIATTEFLVGKTLTGTVQGDVQAPIDIPKYLDLYKQGKLPIDKLISKTYDGLDKVQEGCDALDRGEIIKGVLKI